MSRPMVPALASFIDRLDEIDKRALRRAVAENGTRDDETLTTRLLSAVLLQLAYEESREAVVLAELGEDLDRDHRAVVDEIATRAKFPGEPGYADWLAELGIDPSDDTPAD